MKVWHKKIIALSIGLACAPWALAEVETSPATAPQMQAAVLEVQEPSQNEVAQDLQTIAVGVSTPTTEQVASAIVEAVQTEVAAATQSTEAVPTISVNEAAALFEQEAKPMQLAALSPKEMKETEGAFFNFGTAAFGGFVGGAGYAWSVYRGNTTWNTGRFLGNVGTGALIGGTFGAAGAAASGGARFIPSLTNAGANIWRFNSAAANFGPNLGWRR